MSAAVLSCLCPFCVDDLVSPGPRAEGNPFGGGDSFDLLRSYRPAAPSDAEVDTVQRLRGVVVALGVYLPPTQAVTWFRTDDERLPEGFCTTPKSPQWPRVIQVRAGLAPRRLVTVTLHEFAHLADAREVDMGVPELEQRAEQFAARWTDHACRQLGIR